MTTTGKGSSARCICDHVEAHHATVDMLFGPKSPHCEWRGCGCPRFLQPEEQGPGDAAVHLSREDAVALRDYIRASSRPGQVDPIGRSWRYLYALDAALLATDPKEASA